MLAQAVLEKGILESASLGLSKFATDVGDLVQARPYLFLIVAVVVVWLMLRRR